MIYQAGLRIVDILLNANEARCRMTDNRDGVNDM